jgi:hypothetical protein
VSDTEFAAAPSSPSKHPSWRSTLAVHPAADMFPLLSKDELIALGNDIKKNDIRVPIALWRSADGVDSLLDGRNRLDAAEAVGFEIEFDFECGLVFLKAPDSQRSGLIGWYIDKPSHDPYGIVISLNARRRHLTAEQKREVIAKLLQARPELSDRAAAEIEDQQLRNIERQADFGAEPAQGDEDSICRAWATATKAAKIAFLREYWKELYALLMAQVAS